MQSTDLRWSGSTSADPRTPLLNAGRPPGPFEDAGGYRPGVLGPRAQHFAHLVRISFELSPALARCREVLPAVSEQRLLEIAIAEAAGAQAIFVVPRHLRRRDQLEQDNRKIPIGVRLWFLGCATVHDRS